LSDYGKSYLRVAFSLIARSKRVVGETSLFRLSDSRPSIL